MGRRVWIVIGIALAVVGFSAYIVLIQGAPPPGVETLGDDDAERLAWIGLGTGIVGLLTALAGLVKEIVSVRKA